MQAIVDVDGRKRCIAELLCREALGAGIEEIGMVVRPGEGARLRELKALGGYDVRFIEQSKPMGFGHAITSAAGFVASEPFLLFVGDHLFLSHEDRNCAAQLVDVASRECCVTSGLQSTHESQLPYFGVIGGARVHGDDRLFEVADVVEKPTPTVAEQRLVMPGLRHGHYQCFFGMHVLTARVMETLQQLVAKDADVKRVTLSDALAVVAREERCLGYEVNGSRYDLGTRYGLFQAQLALGLAGAEREEFLEVLVNSMASGAREGAFAGGRKAK